MNNNDLTKLFLQEAGLDTSDESVKAHKWQWWMNPISSTSLRLTQTGAEFLSSGLQLQSYTYKLNKEWRATSKLILALERHMTVPFYFPTKKTIIFFAERDAMMLALYGNDLEAYLINLVKNS
jgi:hypothetical protein